MHIISYLLARAFMDHMVWQSENMELIYKEEKNPSVLFRDQKYSIKPSPELLFWCTEIYFNPVKPDISRTFLNEGKKTT